MGQETNISMFCINFLQVRFVKEFSTTTACFVDLSNSKCKHTNFCDCKGVSASTPL